ncbi:MAG: UDP-N-acetylglucosamine 2-epimerase (non-hydrolyzing) [Candidatus Thorarchaeota archaeon]|nr:UDP-N-acetylglucosamine 2-epimerase (non-hydrolyzing) [Candidatus Thorarchaeota archaeon]
MKPFFVIGTRPEIIKTAPVIQEFEDKQGIRCFLLHTGQHYSDKMSRAFFEDLALRAPDVNLNIGSGSHSQQTAKALVGIEEALLREQPDVVLVQGDTNAVLSAALAASKLQIPIAHIEAGLRSYDRRMPEEFNRRLTDHASDFLFAPTERSAEILRKENVWGKIFVTGNTVIDTLERRLPAAMNAPIPDIAKELDNFAVLTMHRAENVDEKKILSGMIRGLGEIETDIVFPAHPRTVNRIKQFDLMKELDQCENIHLVDPVGYLSFLRLLKMSSFVITDSGGIQEEVTAPSINKRVFVLRTSTERPEAVESGHATVVGVNPNEFPEIIKREIEKGLDRKRPCPYGEGVASEQIVKILLDNLL